MRALALVLAAAALGACGNSAPTGDAARDALVAAWKKGGLDVSAFTKAKTDVGKDCTTGTVGKVDVLVCAYGTEADAKTAADPGLAWVGDTTGASRAKGTLVIAVADRKSADPHGTTIEQIYKLAP